MVRVGAQQARLVFGLRFRQLTRDPFAWLLGLGALVLVSFSTFLGPLPPLDGGVAWRDMVLASCVFIGWAYGLFLLLEPGGRLLSRLHAVPLARSGALFVWGGAELSFLVLLLVPALALGFLVIPGGPSLRDLAMALACMAQAVAMATLAGGLRDWMPRKGEGLVVLVLAWVLVSLPPLHVVDPRSALAAPGTSIGQQALVAGFWLGLVGALLGFRSVIHPQKRI